MLHPGDKDFVYSYTQLTTYEECHYAYYLKYIEENDIETEGNAFAEYGTLCHKLIDEWAKGDLLIPELADQYEQRYSQEVVHKYPAMMVGISEKLYDAGLTYFQNFDGFQGLDIIATEKTYFTEIAGKKFKGVIDMIAYDNFSDELIILDHKSKSLATYKKEQKTIYNQLLLYSKFVYEEMGRWPDKLAFNLFREGGTIVDKQFTMDEYNKVLGWAEKLINEIEENDMFRSIEMKDQPTFYCNELCDVRKGCTFGSTRPPRKGSK